MGRSLLGISIKYSNNNIFNTVTIAMKELEDASGSKYLSKVIIDCLPEYNIHFYQIISITSDNAVNMLNIRKHILTYIDYSNIRSRKDY